MFSQSDGGKRMRTGHGFLEDMDMDNEVPLSRAHVDHPVGELSSRGE